MTVNPARRPRLRPLLSLLTTGILLGGAGCGGGDRLEISPLLQDLTAEAILPTYGALAQQSAALATKAQALCAAPTAQAIADAQAQWRAARLPWKGSLAMAIGPAEDARLESAIGWFPVDPGAIEGVVAGEATLSAAYVEEYLGSSARGLNAVEYLLFTGPEGGDPLEALSGDDGRRCALLQAYAEAIAQETAAVRDAWGARGGGAYGDHFAEAGEDTTVYLYSQQALDHLYNQLVQSTETLADKALAVPLGLKSGEAPDPEDVEARLGGNAHAEALALLGGIGILLKGGGGLGILDLIADRSPGLEATILGAYQDADAALKAIPQPMDEAVLTDPAAVEAAFDAVKALQSTLKVDGAGALGVVLTFSDNDGD